MSEPYYHKRSEALNKIRTREGYGSISCPWCKGENSLRLCNESLVSGKTGDWAIVAWVICDECEYKEDRFFISQHLYSGPLREDD